jgi:hypothetical protein
MPIITADQTRTRLATPLTSDQLDSKYGLVQGLITTRADEGRYSIAVKLGSEDIDQFTSWIQGYGYRVTAWTDEPGTQIRKIVGDVAEVTVFWNKVTPTVASANVVPGNPLYVNLTSVGWNGEILFWEITGSAIATEFLENTLTGSVNLGSDGTASVTLNVSQTAIVGHTAIIKFYWDSGRNELIATAPTITFVAV